MICLLNEYLLYWCSQFKTTPLPQSSSKRQNDWSCACYAQPFSTPPLPTFYLTIIKDKIMQCKKSDDSCDVWGFCNNRNRLPCLFDQFLLQQTNHCRGKRQSVINEVKIWWKANEAILCLWFATIRESIKLPVFEFRKSENFWDNELFWKQVVRCNSYQWWLKEALRTTKTTGASKNYIKAMSVIFCPLPLSYVVKRNVSVLHLSLCYVTNRGSPLNILSNSHKISKIIILQN